MIPEKESTKRKKETKGKKEVNGKERRKGPQREDNEYPATHKTTRRKNEGRGAINTRGRKVRGITVVAVRQDRTALYSKQFAEGAVTSASICVKETRDIKGKARKMGQSRQSNKAKQQTQPAYNTNSTFSVLHKTITNPTYQKTLLSSSVPQFPPNQNLFVPPQIIPIVK